jgi:hypothetical protein
MICPHCGADDTGAIKINVKVARGIRTTKTIKGNNPPRHTVLESRDTTRGELRRRRQCSVCGGRFSTLERVIGADLDEEQPAPQAAAVATHAISETPMATALRMAAGRRTAEVIARSTGIAPEIIDGIMVGRIRIVRRKTADALARGLGQPWLSDALVNGTAVGGA